MFVNLWGSKLNLVLFADVRWDLLAKVALLFAYHLATPAHPAPAFILVLDRIKNVKHLAKWLTCKKHILFIALTKPNTFAHWGLRTVLELYSPQLCALPIVVPPIAHDAPHVFCSKLF